jgi:hypothetical protein
MLNGVGRSNILTLNPAAANLGVNTAPSPPAPPVSKTFFFPSLDIAWFSLHYGFSGRLRQRS